MKYEILLIDGPYLAHRSHTAPYSLKTKSGLDATMIHNFIRSLNATFKKFKPDHVGICWESHGTQSWRRLLYPDYKPSGTIEADFREALNDLRVLLHLLKIKQFYAPGNEADDVLCAIVTQHAKDRSAVIFTRDKDLMQLIYDPEPAVHVWDGKQIFNEAEVIKKFGVTSYQLCDYLSLVGDKVDNIPGVKGIGPKNAVKLIKKYINVEAIPIEEFPKGDDSFMEAINAKRLITLNYEANVQPVFKSDITFQETIEDILNKYELESIKEKLDEYKKIGGSE